jgi:hypothetical protein
MNAAIDSPFGDPMLAWITKGDLVLTSENSKPNELAYKIQGQLDALLEKLANRIRRSSSRFEVELINGRGTANFGPYRDFFTGLGEAFELGVYNLNYALPEAFVGFDRKTGDFLPSEVLSRRPWGFLYHLHGSVHHRIRDSIRRIEDKDSGSKIKWYADLNQTSDTEDWCDVWNANRRSDEKLVTYSSLIAGGWKLDQLQSEPFLSFYSGLHRHMHEADAILIGGYGFGDSHINSVLGNMLRSKATQSRRPPVLVVDFEQTRKAIAKRVDPWSSVMSHTLRVSQQTFRDSQHRTEAQWTRLPETVAEGEFEQPLDRDNELPVATWNGGFNAASGRLTQIVKWLNGDRSAI